MNLARIRKAKGLSQRDLADMIGMDAATIQRAETMHPSAKLSTYQKCADALVVPLEALFGETLTDDEARALALYRRTPEERRPTLLDLFQMVQTPTSEG